MNQRTSGIRRGEEHGFTLIELLIVIVILGILSAVVVFAVGGITDRGNESACRSDRKSLEVAEEAFFAQNKDGGDPDYATEAGLVAGGFLREESDLFNVTLAPDRKSYSINPVGGGCSA